MSTPEDDLDAQLKAASAATMHDFLTDDEVAEAKAKARATIDKERRTAAIKKLIEEETHRLKTEEGMIVGDVAHDEEVFITIDLPEFSACVNINGREYWHSHTYQVPRHVANTLREIQQRTWLHLHEIEGKSKTQAQAMTRNTVLTPTFVKNAPQAMA